MAKTRAWLPLAVVLISHAASPSAAGQVGEWRAYGADKATTKYSPLDQINKDNVHDLEIVWRQSTIPDALRQGNTMRAPGGSQNTPLMAGGLLFISTALGTVAALDATSGEVVWFDPVPEGVGRGDRRLGATRGVAYWSGGPDDQDERVLAVIGRQLVALDAKSGARFPEFGDGGAVDLTTGYGDRRVESFGWRSAPPS